MYILKYVSVFLLMTLCVFNNGVDSKTVTLDGSKCGTCQLESLLGGVGGILSQADDIIIQGIPSAIYTISKPLMCRTMNITSGTVNLNANLNLKGTLNIATGALLVVNSALSSNSLINLDGNILIKGGVSSIAQLNCNGQLKVEAGSLTLNGLLAAATSIPIVTGGSLINNGKCIYNSIPAVSGAAQFIVNGATTLTKGIQFADTSLLSIAAKATVDIQHDSTIINPIKIDNAGEVKLTKGKHIIHGINGATNSLMTIVDSTVQMNAPSKCHKIDLTGAGSVLLNANAIVNDIKAKATAKIDLATTGLLNINGRADIDAMVNLKDSSKIIAAAKSTVNLLGGVTSTATSQVQAMDNSVLNMGKTCMFSQPLLIGKQAILNLNSGSHDFNEGVQSESTSTTNIAKGSKVKTSKDCKFGILNVATGADVNINSGKTIVQGALTTAEKSTFAVANAILNLKANSILKAPLNINAKAHAIIDAKTDLLSGIATHVDAKIDINHNLNILGSSNIAAATNINANGLLVFGGSKDVTHKCSGTIKSDTKSTLNVVSGAILHLDGDATLSGIHKLVDGSQIVVNGNANIITGLTSVGTALSHFTVGPTGNCVLGNVPMPSLPGFPSFPMSSGSSFPSSSSGNSQPSSGNSQPSSGNSQPSSGNSQPSSGDSQPSSGNSMPSTGSSFPSSSGNSQPSSGNSMPSTGSSFPSSSGNSQPSSGNSMPSTGSSFPSSSGNSQPSSGNSQPSSGDSQPSSGNSMPSTGSSFPSSSGNSQPSSGNSMPSTGSSFPSSSGSSTGSYPTGPSHPSIINGNVIVNAGGALNVLGKCNVGQTLQNMGSLVVTQPIVVAGSAFTQSDAKATCNLIAGGSIDAKVVDFVKGTVAGVGALKCGSCNFANTISANLNIVGNVKMASTATIIANLDATIKTFLSKTTSTTVNGKTTTSTVNKTFNFGSQYVPMIVASGTAEIAGNVNIVASADATAKIAQGTIFKFVSAPTVKGAFAGVTNVVSSASGAAGAATGIAKGAMTKSWSLVHSPCACDYGFKYN